MGDPGLRLMPLGGEWRKEGELWIPTSTPVVTAETVSCQARQKLEENCKKRYVSSRKRKYEVPKHKYHSHTTLKEELNRISSEYSDIATVYSIGTTALDRDILCIKLSENINEERQLLKPQVKFVAGRFDNDITIKDSVLF